MKHRVIAVACGVAVLAAVAGGAMMLWTSLGARDARGQQAPAGSTLLGAETAAPTADGVVYAGEYRNSLYDPQTGMSLFWQNDAATLSVGLVSPGTGWLGVGFGNRPGKAGSNIILGAITDRGVTIQDAYGASRVVHLADSASSILAYGGSEEAGQSTLEFAIPLASGDSQDVALVPGQTVQVILAYQATSDSFAAEHTRYSMSRIDLDP